MPTALELTREGWSLYIKNALRRSPPPELTTEEKLKRKQVLTRVKEAAVMLKNRFGVRKVILFGSLAHEAWFIPGSDVDLAVEGLNSKEYWQAWRFVEEIIRDKPVDFIEIEEAGESLRRSIERSGVEL